MNEKPNRKPIIAVTLGDVAGIGPEIVCKGWAQLQQWCRPILLGDEAIIRRTLATVAPSLTVTPLRSIDDWNPDADPSAMLACLQSTSVRLDQLTGGQVHAEAGQAAYDFLVQGIDLALQGKVDALVTMPLNKEGLHRAGLHYPGHTEILAEKTATKSFAMMLYRQGLGVLHVTLHIALRDVFSHLTQERILATIVLADQIMTRLLGKPARVAVTALNPHASDGGLFGDEEERLIAPAVNQARQQGIHVAGPLPADTLFQRAAAGNFDAVVAMYHDQGHIALKVLGWQQAVNVTVGLPIIRTSVAHGTAYDIYGRGLADPCSFHEAVKVAVSLCLKTPSANGSGSSLSSPRMAE